MPTFTNAQRVVSMSIRAAAGMDCKPGTVLTEAKNASNINWSAITPQVTDGSSVILRGVSHTRPDTAPPTPTNHTLIDSNGTQPGYGTYRKNSSTDGAAAQVTISRCTTYTVFTVEVRDVPPPKTGTATVTHDWTQTATGKETPKGTAVVSHAWTSTATGTAPATGTPYTDNFNRADSGTLGSNWTVGSPGWQVLSNQARPGSASISFWSGTSLGANQSSEADFTLAGGELGPMVRVDSSGTGYLLDWHGAAGGTLQFFRRISRTGFTSLGVAATGVGTTGTKRLRLEISGSTLKAYDGGILVGSVTDTTYTIGAPGIWGDGSSGIVDNFSVVDLGSPYDPVTQAFLTASGLDAGTYGPALDILVIGLKSTGLWSKMRAMYPFIGGTADRTSGT